MIVTRKRSFIKAISWRIIGSIDTFILSLIIINFFSNKYTYDLAFYIAALELVTKTVIIIFMKDYGIELILVELKRR
jgi:uncharacterized membrane protein YoaT (DUF817 family)